MALATPDTIERVQALAVPHGHARAFWFGLLLNPCADDWLEQIRTNQKACEARRRSASYDTGSISEQAALCLKALCERYRPLVIAEIGTFIGMSTMAMDAKGTVIYTCDKRNDCGPVSPRIVTHPFTASTTMLRRLEKLGLSVDLFFFDGRIECEDVPLIQELASPNAIYAFDDFVGGEKGVINVDRLYPHMHRVCRLIPPAPDFVDSTIAVLVP